MERRSFIQKTSMATAGLFAGYQPAFAKNQKLKVGLIGAGWYGMVITEAALKTGDVEVLGVCDVDSNHLKSSADTFEKLQGKRPKEYIDYQDLLEEKALQAVFIGSVPQWHALHFIAACHKGLDIYCEKPLAYDIEEGKAMVAAAQQAGNIVQIGFQRRQSKAFAQAKEFIENDKIGKVHRIEAQIHYNPSPGDTTVQAPPASLDWEKWCGPAPKLDYRPSIGHKAWRLEKEYGNGHLVDWGIHHIDIIRKIMNFSMPLAFNSYGSLNILEGKITTPDTLNAHMHFDGCPVLWQHRLWGTGSLNPEYNNGIFFYGEKGTLFAADNRLVLLPHSKNSEQQLLDIATPEMQENHVAEFVDAVKAKSKKRLSCLPADAFLSTATVQLAMAAYYTKSRVAWDEANQSVIDNPAAAQLMARPYRSGYQRPKV